MRLQGYNDHSEIRVEKIDGMAMVRKMTTSTTTTTPTAMLMKGPVFAMSVLRVVYAVG